LRELLNDLLEHLGGIILAALVALAALAALLLLLYLLKYLLDHAHDSTYAAHRSSPGFKGYGVRGQISPCTEA
jgi:hypothetical protein